MLEIVIIKGTDGKGSVVFSGEGVNAILSINAIKFEKVDKTAQSKQVSKYRGTDSVHCAIIFLIFKLAEGCYIHLEQFNNINSAFKVYCTTCDVSLWELKNIVQDVEQGFLELLGLLIHSSPFCNWFCRGSCHDERQVRVNRIVRPSLLPTIKSH